jgi:cystathionine beta-lyase/cystathionine gamma-synthase
VQGLQTAVSEPAVECRGDSADGVLEEAEALLEALESSPHVISVNYPGIDSHPHRAIALKQHRDGMGP